MAASHHECLQQQGPSRKTPAQQITMLAWCRFVNALCNAMKMGSCWAVKFLSCCISPFLKNWYGFGSTAVIA